MRGNLKNYLKLNPDPVTAIETPEPPDEFTIQMKEVIKLVQRDFKKIIKMKKYESLDPKLEYVLRNIKINSETSQEKDNYKTLIKLIVNLIERIKDGSIDDINDLLEYPVENYEFPEEVPQENFSNINLMTPLREAFVGDMDLHKHTSGGKINFGLNWGNPLIKENQGRYDEYGLLSDESKKNVINSYNDVQDVLGKADSVITNFSEKIQNKLDNIDYDKIDKETNKSVEQISKTQEEIDKLYLDKETKQNEKIARITEKVKELEKIQNKKYLGDLDSYNSLKSFSDGQVISVQNFKKDIWYFSK